MEFESPQSFNPEQAIAPDLAFADYDTITAMRKAQAAAVLAAEMQVIHDGGDATRFKNAPAREAARNAVQAGFADQITAFVASHIDRDANPERFDRLTSFLRTVSSDQMTPTKWYNGDVNAEGKHDHETYQTSGRKQLENLLVELSGPQRPAAANGYTPLDQDSPELQAAHAEYEAARDALAELSVKRRQLSGKHGKKAKKLEAQFEEAKERFEASIHNAGILYVNNMQAQGVEDSQITNKLLPWVVEMHTQFTDEEMSLLTADDSRRGRFAKWLAGRSRRLMGVSAAGGGVFGTGAHYTAIGLGAAGVGALTAGLAVPILLSAGLAVRSAKSALMAQVNSSANVHKRFDKNRAIDEREVGADMWELANKRGITPQEVLTTGSKRVGHVITESVNRNIKFNARRKRNALIVGELAAVGFEFIPVGIHGLTHHHTGSNHGGNKNTSRSTTDASTPSEATTPTPATNPPISTAAREVTVSPGDGYILDTQKLSDTLSTVTGHNVHLSVPQSEAVYDHELSLHGGSARGFITEKGKDVVYARGKGQGWGIRGAGTGLWNARIVEEMARYAEENKIAA